MMNFQQSPILPADPRAIYLIGAGGIVKDGHLPAYRGAGFSVGGIFDIREEAARSMADAFSIPRTFSTLGQLIAEAPDRCVFDVAVPASAIVETLERLPDGAAVLIQKPMGENLEQARIIRDVCRRKKLKAAVNFQLRFAPYCLAAKDMIERGLIGRLHQIEVRVTVYTPWHLWSFLEGIPRVEILYHGVHYIDLIRSFLGEPGGVDARTVRQPGVTKIASTRTNLIFHYGDDVQAAIGANHGHRFGLRHQESYVKWEGTRGAIKAQMGLLLNYPKGETDYLEYISVSEDGEGGEWQAVPLSGSWYPEAFVGSMSALMRYADGETQDLPTSVEDSYKTMAVVEAAYQSNASGGTPIPA